MHENYLFPVSESASERIYHALGNPTCLCAIDMPFEAAIPLRQVPDFAAIVTREVRLPIVLPLIATCAFLVAFIPWAASHGKFHIPGYGGIAALGMACGLLLGRLSGARRITGTAVSVSLAVVFFLLMAVAAGCLLALFSYRPPLEE
jgi:hypothetical protein